jgi:hypothetical protein
MRVAAFDASDQRLPDVIVEQNDRGDRVFGHHFGMAALPDGVAATWIAGGAPWDLAAGRVELH